MSKGTQANSGDKANTENQREKGDERRDNPPHTGPTRPGGSSRSKSGSKSNAEKDR
jgi:hypothetical protein